jgi:D-3-phosphoglycerate dehydrogenase
VAGKTVGIVGLGGIGVEVARLCSALGMRVVATRRSATAAQVGKTP